MLQCTKDFISSRTGLTPTREAYFIRFDQPNSSPTNSALNHHVLSFSFLFPLPSTLVLSQSPLCLSIFSTLLPLNRVSTPLIWTLVDTASAYALVETRRVRGGTGKGKRDLLLTTLYAFDLGLTRDNRQEADEVVTTSYLFNPYLFLPSLAFSTSSISNVLHLLSVTLTARG